MDFSRRQALMTTLFGAGAVGLRALATGLPVSFLLNPRKALADSTTPMCATQGKAQYFIFCTSGGGDPLCASTPGTYEDPAIVHSPDPTMTATTLSLQGKQYQAGKPWASLPQAVLDRTVFFHLMTNTPVHPKEPQVLELMGAAQNHEMFPSLLAKAVAPCLNTIQSQPVSLSQPIRYNGTSLPVIPANALKDTLASPTGPLTQLQSLRDQTMNQLYSLYKNGATPSQQAYIDQMVTTQQQVRSLKQSLISTLSSINDNSAGSQVLAAVTLIQMNVSPVIVINIPFGGDNHTDQGLVKEAAQTVSGVATIATLMQQLQSAGLQDQVTFISLNVFGRTLKGNGSASALTGRNHNPNLQTSVLIGKPWKGGVIGGVGPVKSDYGATGIDSATGASTGSGDIAPLDTLGAFAQTVLASVGADPTQVLTGKVVTAALA